MKLARLNLIKATQGFPPDAKRARDIIDATDTVTFDLNGSLIEVRESGKLVLLIPASWAVMTPA